MNYIVKHNIPFFCLRQRVSYEKLEMALWRINFYQKVCRRIGYNVRCKVCQKRNKPLRATLEVEVDNFIYYVELYAQNG